MAINPINVAPNFGALRVTENGNQYEKSNYGKLGGTAAGLAWGGYQVYDMNKFYKQEAGAIKEIIEYCIQGIEKVVPEFGDDLAKAAEQKTVLMNRIIKCFKYGSLAGVLAVSTLMGLGVGAIADFAVNKYKAHKADKEANVEQAQPMEAQIVSEEN